VTATWIVLQKPVSSYNDVEGECYEYPATIPNGRQISEGDYLICSRSHHTAIDGKRIIGLGRIEVIEQYFRESDGREMCVARYGWYRDFENGFTFEDIGGDPRSNMQHSMNRIPVDRETEILRLLLGEFVSDAQVRTQEGRINEDISPSPVSISAPARESTYSEVDAISGPGHFGNWLQSALIERGMTQTALARESGISADSIGKIIRGQIRNPRETTREAIQTALGSTPTVEVTDAILEEINIEGLGEFSDFDPHGDSNQWPEGAGVYVFYDISQRPVYVGQSANVRRRLNQYNEGTRRPWWFHPPIVQSASFIPVEDETTRIQLEKIMITFLKSNAVLNIAHVRR